MSNNQATNLKREVTVPITGAEVASIVAKFSEKNIDTENVALGSSTAVSILQAYHNAIVNQEKFKLSELKINPRDLDLIYSGKDFDSYIENVCTMDWQEGGLEPITPASNYDGLRNYPQTTFYKGTLNINISTRNHIEIEIFDNFIYGGRNRAGDYSDEHPVFAMDVPSSRFIEIVDTEGISITIPDSSVLALQSFLYAREGKDDLDRAKLLIDIYLRDKSKDILSLMELAKEICPHKSLPFAKFVFEYIEERGLQDSVLCHYFGDRSAKAFDLTKLMIDLFSPLDFPYHNFFGHVLPSLKLVKALVASGVINPKYAESAMLGIYAHELGLNITKGAEDHVERGASLIEKDDKIAAQLIRITELEYLEESGLVPSLFINEKIETIVKALEDVGVPKDEAKELIYLIGLVDISNIIESGAIEKSFQVLHEDFLAQVRNRKKIEADFVAHKGKFYVQLYKNVCNGVLSKLQSSDDQFTKIFYELFSSLNNVDCNNKDLISTEVVSKLSLLIKDKIDFWEYIHRRPMIQALIQEKYRLMLFSVKNPQVRAYLDAEFNEYISRIYMRLASQKLG